VADGAEHEHRDERQRRRRVVGVCAGAADAFGLATGVSVTLVGVMIAAALVPAAAAVGIGIAWGIRAVALGAFFLLVLNAVAIHLSAAAVLWYMGYRPDDWVAGAPLDGRSPRQVGALLASVLLLSTAFLGSGAVVASHIGFERDVNRATADVLTETPYGELELVSVHTEFDADRPLGPDRPQQVTVVVARPVDRPYPELSRTIAERVERETGRSVAVVVEFVERQRAGAAASGRSRAV
jgi:uncharacterized membrane protein